ncbi:MAG: LysR family transcriptional regulator [Vitreoscilla sp.]
MNNTSRLDLNLLLTLDTLLAERHVTRAAARLHLSQPAVSVQLARLREAFGDPLLIPGPRGMLPTARAEALRGPLREALAGLQAAVAPAAPFDPATADTTWTIAATDYSGLAVVVPTLARLRGAAPATRLAILESAPQRVARLAEDGAIDLGLQTMDRVDPAMHARKLFDERYVLVARRGHPKLRRRPSLATFCALEHVLVSPDGGGFSGVTDTALAALGRQRRVVLSLPHFIGAMSAVASSDLVAMLPQRLVAGRPDLQTFEPPLHVPGFEMGMFWHERRHRDPGHRWLREQVLAAVSG